jgi:bifunctional enzyme CysN/CysC
VRREAGKASLRLAACGSAGAGRSTLLGRLLREAGAVREGDVHRFTTGGREIVLADPPRGEKGGASLVSLGPGVDAAVILVDAHGGSLAEALRQTYLAHLLGVRHLALAVNKLDLVGDPQAAFGAIEARYRAFAGRAGLADAACLPLSALHGDNAWQPSERMPWHRGPTLRGWIEAIELADRATEGPFRMRVRSAERVEPGSRAWCGPVVGGRVQRGERVRVLPSGLEARVARIVSPEGDLAEAWPGCAAMLVLDPDVDLAPGDLVAAAASPAEVSDQFEATIVWTGKSDMLPGRPYLIEAGGRTAGLTPGVPKYKVDAETLEHLAARTLHLDDIGVCNIALDAPIPFDPYAANRDTGGFRVLDRASHAMVGAGMLHFALRRAQNIHRQAVEVDKEAHAALKGHRPCIVWFTGLSGAGKSTIANLVEKRLHAAGVHTYLLDGDNVRHGLNRDLGFTEADRVENIRRVAEVARLMVDAGLVVLVAFISPFRAERRLARSLVRPGEFLEVFVDTPLAEAERRDPKGLYRKARRGELANFTGIDSPYEAPEAAEVRVDTTATAPAEAARTIVEALASRGVVRG